MMDYCVLLWSHESRKKMSLWSSENREEAAVFFLLFSVFSTNNFLDKNGFCQQIQLKQNFFGLGKFEFLRLKWPKIGHETEKLKTGWYPESGSHNQSIFLSPPLAAPGAKSWEKLTKRGLSVEILESSLWKDGWTLNMDF